MKIIRSVDEYKEKLEQLGGKTIALIYIFEGEQAKGYNHYDTWKSDVLSTWLKAVQELQCKPYIMDMRTFVFKAMNGSLPTIDYVVNLNNGNTDLSTLGLVPSVCSFLSIPCIPCDTVAAVVGENKLLSNLIAYAKNMNIPKELDLSDPTGILRPFSLGSSVGVTRGISGGCENGFLYQEFISGFDMTTPIMYNPMSGKLEVLPAVMYCPKDKNTQWFLGESEKLLHEGYTKKTIELSEGVKEKCLSFVKTFQIRTYCRIDARVMCNSEAELNLVSNRPIETKELRFLEINPMPTIREGINFHTSIDGITSTHPFYSCFSNYMENIKDASFAGFILSCSILGLRATHGK